ncbi:unnamed protein product [Spodoptera littoralis]|uniref:Ion transport domain-containing protein n=1 Tax=Spodoptera littoralis TaxID=7109 RepID=A0A9P0N433_SPOLI|nr:unnamed protein product [Spodoptera littoralis]CAH1640799.1 unnamed protein product [Spodoptera littoralis]
MIRFKNSHRDDAKSASLHLPRDSDDSVLTDNSSNVSDIVEHRQEKINRQLKSRSLDNRKSMEKPAATPSTSESGATLKPFFPTALVKNLTKNSLEILECTLTMRQSATHVTRLNTRLIESMAGGEMAFMSRMMAMGASPNATCRLNHVSVCHLAAMQNTGVLELLIKHGADVYRADKEGRTPLHFAAWEGNVKQIALMLNFPEGLRKRIVECVPLSSQIVGEIKYHSTPVHALTNMTCKSNEEVKLQVDWSDGMEHNCRNIKDMLPPFQNEKNKHGWCYGWTALHAACARAQHHCVELLIAAGADINAQDQFYRTPLDVVGYAHYMGYKIEEKDFKATINLLLTSGKKIQKCRYSPSLNSIDTPLHTAVELESEGSVEQLLLSGASATGWNSEGATPMHICVKKRNKELLQLLADFKYNNEDPYLATIDVKNKQGFTVLCAAIKEGWTQGVCIALGARASITMKANGESPIHIAAQMGNIDILRQIITIAKLTNTLDFRNEKGETALFKAVSHSQLDVLKLLISSGSDIGLVTAMKTNIFHIAAEQGNQDILEYLLEYNPHVTVRLVNKSDNQGPPLFYAVKNNHPVCAELLISKGAQVGIYVPCKDCIGKDILEWQSLLHIAARKNYCEIADIIIKHDSNTVHCPDSAGRTPLHEACSNGNREMIVLLLRKGADLSEVGRGRQPKLKLAPIDILINNLSKPTEFIQEIFDSYISSQGKSLEEANCEVTVDYRVLIPRESDMKQMRVINALINTGNRYDQHRLLLHPLVQTFLFLKWQSLLSFFYSILILHACFVLSLNIYALSIFYYKDKEETVPIFFRSNVWIHIIYLTICMIVIQEIVFVKMKSKRYLICWETWLKIGYITLAVFLPRIVSWETKSSSEWARLVATFALLFSWFEMMFLLSRFPDWGYYVLMFGKVASKVLKILLSFVFLVFGFSVSFMIHFHAKPPFEGPWGAFVTTLVMMTSEFDYNDSLSKDSILKASGSLFMSRLIFITFLILVSIVLMNLIVGVAVNDVNNLEIIGSIKRLEKQAEFITSLEDIVCNKLLESILPKRLYSKLKNNIRLESVIVLRPRKATCYNRNRLPTRLREATFERVQLQKKQSDEHLGSMVFQMKLDEISSTIKGIADKQCANDTSTTLNQIFKELREMKSDIDQIKQFIEITKRRSLCSNKSVPLIVVPKEQ